MSELSLEDFLLAESELVPDEYAAPSNIEWRVYEITYHRDGLRYQQVPEEQFYYDKWLYENIENLLFVERGGV